MHVGRGLIQLASLAEKDKNLLSSFYSFLNPRPWNSAIPVYHRKQHHRHVWRCLSKVIQNLVLSIVTSWPKEQSGQKRWSTVRTIPVTIQSCAVADIVTLKEGTRQFTVYKRTVTKGRNSFPLVYPVFISLKRPCFTEYSTKC